MGEIGGGVEEGEIGSREVHYILFGRLSFMDKLLFWVLNLQEKEK